MKWCNYYNMWCSDVEYLTFEKCICNLECDLCEYMEIIKYSNFKRWFL